MKAFLSVLLIAISISLHSQYYYNDIVGTQETNRQMKTYMMNKVRSVSAKGTSTAGTLTPSDYSEYQEIRENGKGLKISQFNNGNKTIYYNRFDDQGRLISITDSSSAIQNVTSYDYDAAGRINMVRNTSKDSSMDFNQSEVHIWIYNTAGMPEKMWRIINNTDSLEVRYKPDENGNPGEERTYRRGVETGGDYYYYDEKKQLNFVNTGIIYYYFDDKKRLTDVVRYNLKAKRLLPDIMFEYDDNDHIVQRITTTSSLNLGYLIWRYIYNEQGLKTKEALFNNQKEMTGRIDYNYTFQ